MTVKLAEKSSPLPDQTFGFLSNPTNKKSRNLTHHQ
jgi:hypothetical protein